MDVLPTRAVITSNTGGYDSENSDVMQSLPYHYFNFTDENFPPRASMTPRLQAKLPKMFGWQLKPGYEYYMWVDGNISLAHPDTLKYFEDNCEDFVALQHPTHKTIHWEYRYTWRGLHSNAPSNYLVNRYKGEFLDEQYQVIKDDPDYTDDLMLNGGMFMYRNTPKVQSMLKEWWHHVSRYCINDQISLPYVLKQSGIKYKVLPDVWNDCKWFTNNRHTVNK